MTEPVITLAPDKVVLDPSLSGQGCRRRIKVRDYLQVTARFSQRPSSMLCTFKTRRSRIRQFKILYALFALMKNGWVCGDYYLGVKSFFCLCILIMKQSLSMFPRC
jgi:hypothetical protein